MVLCVIGTLGGFAGGARGATLEGLLMPGPLHSEHAKQESDCSSCHNRADRVQQASLCSACHKDVAADIRDNRGLHGKRPEIASAQCNACHSEHLGRGGRIQPVLAAAFDHAQTDMRIDGVHRNVACAGCHLPGRKYREAPTGCVDCHKKAEPHQGKLGTDCVSCHETSRWSAVRYDHGKTRFALQARHAQIPCASCHAANRWKDTPLACASCHTPDDVHRGSRGTACADCHTQSSWKDAKFDHEKETGFALAGAHRTATCQSCHRSGRLEDRIPKDCAGCHAAIDMHIGRMGTQCESCHDTSAWKETHFVHERDTKFTLRGAHARLSCHNCHVARVTERKPQQQCAACHRAVDVHAGALGSSCESCHNVDSWKKDIRFDHDVTAFPLLGQHVAVPCAGCHISKQFKGAPKDCAGCHKTDDVHKGNLGKDCARCHSPNGWTLWQFDHRQESGFGLTGAHSRLQCNACHRRPAGEAKLGKDCAACHANDDIHLGQFGRRCDTCHSTITFKRARPQ